MSSVKAGKQDRQTRGPNPRLTSALILKEALAGRSLSDVAPDRLSKLENPRDRALSQELCYGVMRWYPQLDWLLRQLIKKPLKSKDRDVLALLLCGLYQLLYTRVAEHAAVHETAAVAAALRKCWAVGLINGVLREFQRQRDSLLDAMQTDEVAQSALPSWLLTRIRQRWPDQWQERVEAMNQRPPMSLRVNLRKLEREDYLQQLRQQGINASPITVTRSGVVLERPMDVQGLPGFQIGQVSVQDAGAQLAAELLDLQAGQRVLDACAAPGGKTGHILESADDLRVTALDLKPGRLQRIEENLSRLQLVAEVVQGDAAAPQGEWAEREYDRILLDVPCSATGVIRRHPDIKVLRRAEDIEALAELQGCILSAIWPLLKVGGKLLYATCSILAEENEAQILGFLQREACARELPLPTGWGEAREAGRQIAPGMQQMDGFYYALLTKVEA